MLQSVLDEDKSVYADRLLQQCHVFQVSLCKMQIIL